MSIKRALVSVSDKRGIVEFCRELSKLGVEIVSTGGTSSLLSKEGIPVIGISEVTGFPEIMDGRVKTLHPAVHSGLLAVRDNEEHQRQMKELGLDYIDLVVVNLYPFAETIAKPGVTYEDAIENIDIGGPTMLRSAAKNHAFVSVVVDADDYSTVLEEIRKDGDTELNTRKRLAAKVFRHTAAYDALISDYLSNVTGDPLPERYTVTYEKIQDLRYGENPHQQAAFYREPLAAKGTLTTAKQLHGKELSYNNINDANAALQIVKEFSEPTVVAVKHMNPCGVGIGGSIYEAYSKAYAADPTSIFGGIVAANRIIDGDTANKLSEIFLEIILAPGFTKEALEILTKKKNIRLLDLGELSPAEQAKSRYVVTSIEGGMVVQQNDVHAVDPDALTVVTERAPSEEELKQLLFSWKVVKHVKSNAIVLAADNMTIGVGAGQMNRVGAAKIAIEQAGDKAKGAVLASDAFFPMGDTLELAAKAGITAVIQPGGSIKDEESIKVANEYGIAMVFTGVRHFKH
ncbi:bifunctional phosphoribosylaminoimidazolecarboxamide formyltransferase/IMP cyclohydrolase [Paenibacillus sp. CMAA1739]|uniref:bifunctional phosphoribosylaminoimidazolecarboxamide formyltransferase/IMP cyclohydrolase n=1 Tax=Paenibacillus ottowii TaxID=2315729 RepID=UPI0011B16E7B|nr:MULTISPECIES: bifunctional phosphoribosylaminoimidazolecarboxamide formyltransferase/IMP cyclohydrolase [Paenibacillus]MDP1510130.1 bifunctional phosphoribosylaminoimidazolecarboxamide formyltransferase/IMP cyclohydrolase [Paenibacillus ottowii]MEC4568098.1 bifunctional phosphoribosylaminoimidazolecarboxamide formyltransferase/IMP cyclohydrolase [Paenibacillus sp. CMAA1739]QDY85588.1 bifunctional phosphoribosylaminoimidazolecarboxamide formyltransferase/IMP cyclohydrolase [Paenibacillus polym